VAQRLRALDCVLAVARSGHHLAAHFGPRVRGAVVRVAVVGRLRKEAAAGVAGPRRPAAVAGRCVRVFTLKLVDLVVKCHATHHGHF